MQMHFKLSRFVPTALTNRQNDKRSSKIRLIYSIVTYNIIFNDIVQTNETVYIFPNTKTCIHINVY